VAPPGVYRPRSDTALLAANFPEIGGGGDVTALDLCTGTGALALHAARRGLRVTAVDACRRAVLAARLNARLNRLPLRVLRGDLFAPVARERFDLVLANPPYLPTPPPAAARRLRRRSRAWDAGPDGRAILERICAGCADHLRPGGRLLLVQSSLAGTEPTLAALERAGLEARVAVEEEGPLGPIAAERAGYLESRGLLAPGARGERLVVIAAARPAAIG
jgi:release factor glutamine methyltransferase